MDVYEELRRGNLEARLQFASEQRECENFFVELIKRKIWWQVHGDITDNTEYMSHGKRARTESLRYQEYKDDGVSFGGKNTQSRSIFSLHQVEVGSGEWNTVAELLKFSHNSVAARLCAIQRVQNPELHAIWLGYMKDNPPEDPKIEFRIGYHGATCTSRWSSILSQGVQPALCRHGKCGVGTFFAGDAAESLNPGYAPSYTCRSDPETKKYCFIGLFACYAGKTKISLSAGGPIPKGYGSHGSQDSGPDCIPTAFCVQDYARVYPAYMLTFAVR